jgi:hypothetical protein
MKSTELVIDERQLSWLGYIQRMTYNRNLRNRRAGKE